MIEPEHLPETLAELGGIRDRPRDEMVLFRRFGAIAVIAPDCELAPEQLDVVSRFVWEQLAPLRVEVVSWAAFELS